MEINKDLEKVEIEPLFVCSKRDIAAVNFIMHEVHCHRNIVLCRQCDEPVPKSELDRHFDDVHALVTCHSCGQAVEKSALDNHKVRAVIFKGYTLTVVVQYVCNRRMYVCACVRACVRVLQRLLQST